ncbi:MAG: hypothetical protein JO257_21910 [Deltaproteobacteria bacterium]|nr:hypothetical protein [Deltaproteobacteria bacterium]
MSVLIGACGADGKSGPPTRPGEDAAPCELVSASYLIDSVTVASDVSLDLSDPPDGIPDSNQFPDLSLDCFGAPLSDAIQRAFASHHALWVATIDSCTDPTNPYARISFERGVMIDTSSPATVTVVSDASVAAVGTKRSNSFDATRGEGAVPISVVTDVAADTSDTGWEEGYNFTSHIDVITPSVIDGYVAFAVDTATSIPLISGPLAHSIDAAVASDPGCPANCSNPWIMQMVSAFDVNGDGMVDTSEVMSRNLDIINVFPSLDLLSPVNDQLVYWPGHDRVADSMGTSFRFRATQVSVTR